ncbi:MAG TPA: MFS transporter [Terracidiphilus sp.]|nr:MFS transporter [Terracidiphilus sp.]
MSLLPDFSRLSRPQKHAFTAAFLGWTLDSLDFFLLIFCVKAMAADFRTDVSTVMEAVFWTQALRPVGALIFGMLADRYGRRPVLIFNILSFSIIELSCAFAPTLHVLLGLRALFGIAMGGEWGVGAALVFETLPKQGRGGFSGILQEGYAVGSILASAAFGLLFHWIGWRGLFVVGASPALLVLYVQWKVEESPVWLAAAQARKQSRATRAPGIRPGRLSGSRPGRLSGSRPGLLSGPLLPPHLKEFLPTFFFLVLLMTAFMSFSHGTQDLYPTFLLVQVKLTAHVVGVIGVVYGLGSIVGGFVFGVASERWGRKKAIVAAALLALPVIPLWAYGHSAWVLGTGAVLMQFMVQGAWGVVPAYLTELSPGPVRATAPGLAYQLGGLVTSWNGVLQARVAEWWGTYPPVLAFTVVIVALALAALAAMGREAKGAEMTA